MRDTLKEIDRPGGVIPVTPKAVGDLIDEVRRLRDSAKHPSIRCPECAGLNAERDARFAPPRQYFSPDIELSTALQIKGADLLIIAGKIIACGDADIARRLYIREIHAALNSLDEALNAFERNSE